MIHETITEAFNSVTIKEWTLSEEIIKQEINRLESQYVKMLADYISIPYSYDLYEDLLVDFNQRIEGKMAQLIDDLSESEKTFIEQNIESFKLEKLRCKEQIDDLKRKEENFIKWQWYFEETISIWKSML